jgi:hypothetical protein
VYTAMVHARWRVAVERRTPALTITAGRMSRPICERMGFQYLEPISIFVDGLTSAEPEGGTKTAVLGPPSASHALRQE